MALIVLERDQKSDHACQAQGCPFVPCKASTFILEDTSDRMLGFCANCAEPWGEGNGFGDRVYLTFNLPIPERPKPEPASKRPISKEEREFLVAKGSKPSRRLDIGIPA